MLVRTFRLTDKLSNAFLKLAIYLTNLLSLRILGLRRAIEATIAAIVLTLFGAGRAVVRTGTRVTQRGQAVATQRQEQIRQVMVQRTEQRALEIQQGKVVEDPMMARNRSLSAITVILLLVLIGVLIWTPNNERGSTLGQTGGGIIPPAQVEELEAVIPTPSPSPTSIEPILSEVSGTLVFTVRQNGQEDIWALPVGSSQPIRMTDSLEDDRDPAWSPDGGKIAFSSRRGGNWDLYILDLVEGRTVQLTFTPDYEAAPTWSPDGAFIAFEGYNAQTQNIDIYIISSDGQEGPFPLTSSPFPDTQPNWSPGGREIAYVGWRNGSQDILLLSLEGQPESEALNVTNSPTIQESSPQWSPEGTRIAYTAVPEGIEGIYVKSVISPGDEARLIGRGRMPTWNPMDGSSVFYTVPQGRSSAVYLGQVDNFGVGANAVAFPGLISDLDWTASQHSLSGFDPRTPPLYEEQITELPDGKIGLALLNDVTAPDPVLSDAVNDSFEAMRRRVAEKVGYDLLGTLESAFWRRERLPDPGQDRDSWHYTGRAIGLNRDLVFAGNPTPLVVIREDTELGVMWRVMARVAESAQNGALGEPLRNIPWDFASRSEDAAAFEAGGRLMETIPAGYYVDVTQLFRDFGWERIPSDRTWRSNYAGVLFWDFQKTDNLSWEAAMLQIYTQAEVDEFIAGIVPPPPTPIPSPTLAGEEEAQPEGDNGNGEVLPTDDGLPEGVSPGIATAIPTATPNP